MSIQGQSFTSSFAGGSHVDFGVGTGGLADLFKSDYTIAVLEKGVSNTRGLLGSYSDTGAASHLGDFFLSNNSGGRMFGSNDFSTGYPDPASVPASPLIGDTWGWKTQSKATGAAHFKFGYSVLSTGAWSLGETGSPANHNDNATTAVMLSTFCIYPNGFNSQDIAAIVAWPTQLSDADIMASCTQALADIFVVSDPIWIISFEEANAGSAVVDLTGNGADETARQFIVTSADPPDFDFSLGSSYDTTQFFAFL
jgi:hypothetical protein